jgi:gamma-glutamyltranspeptidase/glutathione hydrolase
VVSSVEVNATRAGISVLEAGGNAVDAAVAVGYALAVTHPSAGNIGGGGFLLFKAKGQETVAIDFREVAPRSLTQAGFDAMIRAGAHDARASGVPGSVKGLNLALARFGRLPRAKVMAPAIALAKLGHALGERQAQVLKWSWSVLEHDPASRQLFGAAKGPLARGATLVQPALATVLERIAKEGDSGFYTGPTAASLVGYMQKHGGWISAQDLLDYQPVLRRPLTVRYHDFDLDVMSPTSAGGVALVQILAMLERTHAEQWSPDSAEGLHLFIEISKRAHAERRFHVADPESLTDYDDAARRARWADPNTWLRPFPISMTEVTPAEKLDPLYAAAKAELDHTTHFSVVDGEGNAVSCTMTLSGGFGAKYTIGELGVVMNNSVAAFGTVGENTPAPGRRMTSSMAPTIASYQGQLALVLGTPGGDTIPSTLAQVLRQLIDGHMNLEQSVDAPRVHHGFVPDLLRSESLRPLRRATRLQLEKLGHVFAEPNLAIGDVNAVMVLGEDAYGYADPREGGVALGVSTP